jgi:hypothetical protein
LNAAVPINPGAALNVPSDGSAAVAGAAQNTPIDRGMMGAALPAGAGQRTEDLERMHVSASARHGTRDMLASIVAAAAATILVGSVVYAEPTGGLFPVLLRDHSCEDVGSDQSNPAPDCDPDASSWACGSDVSQVQQVIVADNVDAPGSVAVATQDQDAPVTRFP